MRDQEHMRRKAMAAAIALALGAATALAQQQPSSQQPRSGEPAQVPPASHEPLPSEQPSSSREEVDQLGAQSQGDEAFDKLSAEHADLATFSEAVKTAGLADSLTGGTQYTVFAPTDEAWEKSGQNADELMQPQNREELVSLLRAHIVADDVDQELASRIAKAKTVDGGEVDIQAENGELMVGNAKAVDAAGIEMDSLRIYPIDAVLAANASAPSAFDDTSRESSSDVGSRSTQESTREPRDTALPSDSQPGRTRETPAAPPPGGAAPPPGGQPPRQ